MQDLAELQKAVHGDRLGINLSKDLRSCLRAGEAEGLGHVALTPPGNGGGPLDGCELFPERLEIPQSECQRRVEPCEFYDFLGETHEPEYAPLPVLELLHGGGDRLRHRKPEPVEGSAALLGEGRLHGDMIKGEFELGLLLHFLGSVGLHDPEAGFEFLPATVLFLAERLQIGPRLKNHYALLRERIQLSLLKAESGSVHAMKIPCE